MYLQQNVFSRVASVLSALTMLCFVACGGEYTGYKVILPEQPDMAVPPSVDMAMPTQPEPTFKLRFRCLASPICGFKFRHRDTNKNDVLKEWTMQRGDYKTFNLEIADVCDRDIYDTGGLKIDGQPAGTFTRGLEVTVTNISGEYYRSWAQKGHASCRDAFELSELYVTTDERGMRKEEWVPIPTVTFEKSTGEFNCLVSEDYLHGRFDKFKCTYLGW